jgi:hypothetical protein
MQLVTLGDVRTPIEKHLPAEFREKETWRYVWLRLNEAAHGGDTAHAVVALRLVLMMESVECRPM